MKPSSKSSRRFVNCIAVGFCVMSFALFLDPMNPNDFLALALSAPLETIRESYGIQSAASFWISVVLISFGVIGLCQGRVRNE